jgi:hypothetical protein
LIRHDVTDDFAVVVRNKDAQLGGRLVFQETVGELCHEWKGGQVWIYAEICPEGGLYPSFAGGLGDGAIMTNAGVSLKRASAPHTKKRLLADSLIAAKPSLANRELARVAGVFHVYVVNRRRLAQSGNK